MKENIYDRVLEKTYARIDKATTRIARDFKNVQPFDKEKMDNRALLNYYDELNSDDMLFLIQKHGEDTVASFIHDMEMARSKL